MLLWCKEVYFRQTLYLYVFIGACVSGENLVREISVRSVYKPVEKPVYFSNCNSSSNAINLLISHLPLPPGIFNSCCSVSKFPLVSSIYILLLFLSTSFFHYMFRDLQWNLQPHSDRYYWTWVRKESYKLGLPFDVFLCPEVSMDLAH